MSTRTGCHLWPTRWNVNKRLAFNRRRCNINHVTLTSRMTSTTAVQYRYVTPLPAWWWRRSRHVTATTVSINRAVTWLCYTLVTRHSHRRRRHSRLDRRRSSAFRRYFTSLRFVSGVLQLRSSFSLICHSIPLTATIVLLTVPSILLTVVIILFRDSHPLRNFIVRPTLWVTVEKLKWMRKTSKVMASILSLLLCVF